MVDKRSIKVLVVEDSEEDCDLLIRELKHTYNVKYQRVETPQQMSAALDLGQWDLVLADHKMPQFSAPAALGLMRLKNMHLPFIVISTTPVPETAAFELIAQGVNHMLVKGDYPRLLPAIQFALDASAKKPVS